MDWRDNVGNVVVVRSDSNKWVVELKIYGFDGVLGLLKEVLGEDGEEVFWSMGGFEKELRDGVEFIWIGGSEVFLVVRDDVMGKELDVFGGWVDSVIMGLMKWMLMEDLYGSVSWKDFGWDWKVNGWKVGWFDKSVVLRKDDNLWVFGDCNEVLAEMEFGVEDIELMNGLVKCVMDEEL